MKTMHSLLVQRQWNFFRLSEIKIIQKNHGVQFNHFVQIQKWLILKSQLINNSILYHHIYFILKNQSTSFFVDGSKNQSFLAHWKSNNKVNL